MSAKDVLAIDFGTANSYYCKCPGDQLTPNGIDFGDGRDGLATAILYRNSKAPLVGHAALEEYGEATVQERSRYILRTHFKPDIITSEEARRNAADFLGAVLEDARNQRLDITPELRQVIFGVPSEGGKEYRNALGAAARTAGYGEVEMVDEPKGALLYHVFHKDIPSADALKGLLVVDFGGGTCDFAFLRRGKVQHSWGNMRLGGRLFDDLFFQWFIDDNPGALESLRKDGSEYFAHSYLCRETKEFFSRTMARDRSEKVTKAVRHYGRITDMNWDTFLKRADSYSASETFSRFLAEIGGSEAIADSRNAGIGLLSRFRKYLTDGLLAAKIDRSDIRFVILAGGSSLWPFVPDIVQEELGIERNRIMRSDRPYAAISEGLAILPALQARNRVTQEKLREELPRFLNTELKPLVVRRTKTVAEEIATGITQELFDEKLKLLLIEFRTQGGSVASLRGRFASTAASFEPRLRGLINEKVLVLTKGLPSDVKELQAKWFDAHGLALPEDDMVVEGVDAEKVGKSDLEVPDFYGGIIDTISIFAMGFTTSIVAMICGGGGMALIASGPIGWIIGAVLGLGTGYLAKTYVAEKAKQMAKDWSVPGWILKMAIADGKIAKVREKLAADINSAVQRELSGMKDKLAELVSQQVEREIDALSDINHL
jgi:molecular chaperone DnaK